MKTITPEAAQKAFKSLTKTERKALADHLFFGSDLRRKLAGKGLVVLRVEKCGGISVNLTPLGKEVSALSRRGLEVRPVGEVGK